MDSFFGIDLAALVQAVGYLGFFGIVFAESGLLVGFFLPGDSMLFTGGFLASQGFFNVWVLVVLAVGGAIIGDQVGYFFGQRIGPKIFTREDSLWFHKDYIRRAEAFYEVHGKKTIILARFIPVVRTFAPIVAGVGKMEYKTFVKYNVVGGVLWGAGATLLGYFLGNIFPNADKFIFWVALAIIFLSVIPAVIPILRLKLPKKI